VSTNLFSLFFEAKTISASDASRRLNQMALGPTFLKGGQPFWPLKNHGGFLMISSEVDAALKTAMKAHDQAATSCLRMVRAALKNKAKDLQRELNEEEEIACLRTLAKQRRDSIEQFEKGGREDLARKEAAELKIIESYLPQQLGEEHIAPILDEVFEELNPKSPKEMGKVMKVVMSRLKGQADGKLVNQLVQKRLKG
jgi:hypothetical protein